ncbi:unnamed protein product [Timema podura]|uniref:ATP synthase subunit f, mitochondrial n=1 Tax=Timema podura TaxID=61482 RepID=A0ABN7PJU2_TIMPD|nr:unnamed protein product [Timema podura]
MAIGDYPIEYNPKVHGPYDPARFYGKPDTPFGQLKLNEIGSWLGRRNKSPSAVVGSISREVHWSITLMGGHSPVAECAVSSVSQVRLSHD